MLNNVVLMGRLTRDVELRYSQSGNKASGSFTLAVDRDYKGQNGERLTDFINCVAFDKTAEFIGRHFRKGSMLAVVGRIQTGSYTNKEGQKVYTTDVVVQLASFTGEKSDGQQAAPTPTPAQHDGFMLMPDGVEDEDLPFN